MSSLRSSSSSSEEELKKAYQGSSMFLKGTQSANPHNDYQQHFVDTGWKHVGVYPLHLFNRNIG